MGMSPNATEHASANLSTLARIFGSCFLVFLIAPSIPPYLYGSHLVQFHVSDVSPVSAQANGPEHALPFGLHAPKGAGNLPAHLCARALARPLATYSGISLQERA
jgi:hypothetical protein